MLILVGLFFMLISAIVGIVGPLFDENMMLRWQYGVGVVGILLVLIGLCT